jgi:hypothetical protein
LSTEKALTKMLYQKYFDVSAWGKLYRRNLFDSIKYPIGKLYEDNGTTYLLIAKSSKIAFSSIIGYYYVQRANSIMNSCFSISKMDGYELSSQMVEYVSLNFKHAKKAAI